MDVLVTCKYDVSSMTNLRRPVRLQNVFLTFRKPNNTFERARVKDVFKTSGRRFTDVLDVFGLSRCPFEVLLQFSKRLEDVMKTCWTYPICNAFGVTDTSSRRFRWKRVSHVIRTCPFEVLLQFSKRLEDVMKTCWTSPICNAFGVTDTSSRRFRWKRLLNLIRTCPFEVLLQFSIRLEDVMKTCWARLQHVLGGNVFHTLSERVRLRCCFSFPNV